MRLQNSGLLYLRSNSQTPEAFQYRINFLNGMKTVYKIPIMKNMDYSLEEIFEKKLYMLLPFYILNYEKWMQKEDAGKVMNTLESDLQMIYNELNKSARKAVISNCEEKLSCS